MLVRRKSYLPIKLTEDSMYWSYSYWFYYTPGLSTTFLVVRPPLIWPWEGSNYPFRFCNGPHGPKGPKLKTNLVFSAIINQNLLKLPNEVLKLKQAQGISETINNIHWGVRTCKLHEMSIGQDSRSTESHSSLHVQNPWSTTAMLCPEIQDPLDPAIPWSGATLAHFWGFCAITHIIDSPTMIKYCVCVRHNVLKALIKTRDF